MWQRSICSGLLFIVLSSVAAAPAAAADLTRKLTVSKEIYEELYGQEGDEKKRIIANAVCIAVVPHVVKGAFGIGGHKGTGVMSCKNEDVWSAPSFVKLTGGSVGFQVGGQVTDLILFFMTKRGVESLLDTEFTLGAEAGVAAGPFGRSAEANTDLKFKAEIYSYAKSRGVFAGVSIEGGRMAVGQKANQNYYGERLWPDEILFENKVSSIPAAAKSFIDSLPGGDG